MNRQEKIEVMKKPSFNVFCFKYLDGLYVGNFSYDEQCTGYKQLREMVESQITPATKEETERWEKHPTKEELTAIPDIKYMRSLHPNLRNFVREKWSYIKDLKL